MTKYILKDYKYYRQKQVGGQGGRGILGDQERPDKKGDFKHLKMVREQVKTNLQEKNVLRRENRNWKGLVVKA